MLIPGTLFVDDDIVETLGMFQPVDAACRCSFDTVSPPDECHCYHFVSAHIAIEPVWKTGRPRVWQTKSHLHLSA